MYSRVNTVGTCDDDADQRQTLPSFSLFFERHLADDSYHQHWSSNLTIHSIMKSCSVLVLATILSTTNAFSVSPLSHGQPFVVSRSGISSSSSSSSSSSLHAVAIEEPPQASTELVSTDSENKELTSKSWTDDGFVFGLDGSGLERPKGREANIVVEGDSLETQTYQQVMVGVTFLAHSVFAATSISDMLQNNSGDIAMTAAQTLALTISSWILADFGSGVLHWSVDNYGNGRTPIMGGIIAAFQGHHSAPWTITQRGFCNNVYKLCIPFGPVTMAAVSQLDGHNPFITYFLTVFCALEIGSQEFHKWSHQLPSETPQWVNWLQKVNLTIGRKPHAQHHLAPYDGNYCIVSGLCNPILDESGFFRRLEHVVYQLNGVESNAWKLDAELRERTLRGEYQLPTAASKRS